MTDSKDFGNEEIRPEEGSEAQAGETGEASDPDSPDQLTVDDILGAQQTADAAAEDVNDGGAEQAGGPDSSLLNDLKRLQAEYANYRRRTEEQRDVVIGRAKGSVAKNLLPVLDDLDRAEKHGDLIEDSPMWAIGEKLRGIVERMGVQTYGAVGERFDPQQHEAIFQAPTPGATEATILEVVETGYRLGSVELRPAKVVVAVPVDPPTSSQTGSTDSGA